VSGHGSDQQPGQRGLLSAQAFWLKDKPLGFPVPQWNALVLIWGVIWGLENAENWSLETGG
jgi:hypothetical protein